MSDTTTQNSKKNSIKPLQGLLVVTLEQSVAAQYCSSRLADAGARAIKIERPDGDFALGDDRHVHGESSYFVWINRGKESIALNLEKPVDLITVSGSPSECGRIGVSLCDVSASMIVDGAVTDVFAGLESAQTIQRLDMEHSQLRTRGMPVSHHVVKIPALPWLVEWESPSFIPAPDINIHGEALRQEFAASASPLFSKPH